MSWRTLCIHCCEHLLICYWLKLNRAKSVENRNENWKHIKFRKVFHFRVSVWIWIFESLVSTTAVETNTSSKHRLPTRRSYKMIVSRSFQVPIYHRLLRCTRTRGIHHHLLIIGAEAMFFRSLSSSCKSVGRGKLSRSIMGNKSSIATKSGTQSLFDFDAESSTAEQQERIKLASFK